MNEIMKRNNHIWAICLSVIALTACTDDIEEGAYYTFTGDTVSSYCQSDEDYSTFTRLLDDTGNLALLSTYGHYTCFLPDNAAFQRYFEANATSYSQLSRDEKAEIVYNHVIKSYATDYTSEHFEEGALGEPSMSDNFIVISYVSDPSGDGLTIYVNKDVPIVERDIDVHNGVVHKVGEVISPTKDYVCDIIDQPEIIGNQSFKLFSQALKLTNLDDSLKRTYDLSYVCPSPTGVENVAGWNMRYPTTKRLGYTIFAEPDAVMSENGINSIEDLIEYAERYYDSESDDYTSRDNALNKFVSYHILDRQMSTNAFLYSGKMTTANCAKDRVEFYETFYTYRIIKFAVGNILNKQKNGLGVKVNENLSNLSGINGYVHSIDDMLVYDKDVMENDVLNCRFRFDMFNIPSEFTNNNIRWHLSGMEGDVSGYTVTPDFCKHLQFSKETEVTFWGSEWWSVYQEDEMKLNGWYEFNLRLLPVPPGSYELRVGYSPATWRGIAQMFIDEQIQGIPRDLRIYGYDPAVGWVADTGTDQDIEIDKAMRNRGYMKAPASAWSQNAQKNFRDMDNCLRIIIGTFNFQEYSEHWFRAKNVYAQDREYNGDYIELIPTSLIEREDIY
ncbi:MAG: fasciclin domain-containing protein [Muribaculaceae bacterium]|nr:fasciclin domain-containing protein [Muribaculaceae bacterium]